MDTNLINAILGENPMEQSINIDELNKPNVQVDDGKKSDVKSNPPSGAEEQTTDEVKPSETEKQSSDTNEQEENFQSLANELGLATGFNILDESGKPVVFEDSQNGLIERERMLVDLVRQQTIQEVQQNLLSNPEFVKSLAQQSAETTYSGLSFDTLNDEQKIVILQNAMLEKGLNNDIINYTISKAIEDKKLDALSKPALMELQQAEQQYVQQLASEQLAQQQEYESLMGDAQNELISLLNKGEITSGGQSIKVPSIIETEIDGKKQMLTRTDLFNYITSPAVEMEDGSVMTQYQYDSIMKMQQKTVDDVVLEAIQMLTKQSVIDNQANSDLKSKYDNLRNKVTPQKSVQAQGAGKNANLVDLIKANLV